MGAGAQLDVFQRAVIVFTIVPRRRRRRPHCLRKVPILWNYNARQKYLKQLIFFVVLYARFNC